MPSPDNAFPLSAEQIVRMTAEVLATVLDRTRGQGEREIDRVSLTVSLGKAVGISIPWRIDEARGAMLIPYGEAVSPSPIDPSSRPSTHGAADAV